MLARAMAVALVLTMTTIMGTATLETLLMHKLSKMHLPRMDSVQNRRVTTIIRRIMEEKARATLFRHSRRAWGPKAETLLNPDLILMSKVHRPHQGPQRATTMQPRPVSQAQARTPLALARPRVRVAVAMQTL